MRLTIMMLGVLTSYSINAHAFNNCKLIDFYRSKIDKNQEEPEQHYVKSILPYFDIDKVKAKARFDYLKAEQTRLVEEEKLTQVDSILWSFDEFYENYQYEQAYPFALLQTPTGYVETCNENIGELILKTSFNKVPNNITSVKVLLVKIENKWFISGLKTHSTSNEIIFFNY
ncbi:hypothetical protein RI845_06370 [Thalassotalea nanhaiensis]|uniref:DUF3828 domain-containing protein n=1 Tax=Thalassotalea nanhaiensis TaxID=3065648 RepID=A0ABY9TLS4_9GAMM|nr:hypothetical protein RI845_06370 [Colwelliaceae bacterium SQ345]